MSAYLLLAEQLDAQAARFDEDARTARAQAAVLREWAHGGDRAQPSAPAALLSVADITKRWSCGETTVRGLIKAGKLLKVVIGEEGVRVPLAAVEAYEKRNTRRTA